VESCGNPEEFLLESCWNLIEFLWNHVGILRNSCGNAVEFMWKSCRIHEETCGICMEMLWKSWGNPGGNLTENELPRCTHLKMRTPSVRFLGLMKYYFRMNFFPMVLVVNFFQNTSLPHKIEISKKRTQPNKFT